VEAVNALDDGSVGVARERVVHVDPAKHEDAVLDLDLPTRVRGEFPPAGLDLARLQRAPEGARQSAGGGCDEIVESRRVGRKAVLRDAVMLCDLVVYAEGDGAVAARKLGLAHGPPPPDDAHLGRVDDVSHLVRSPPLVGASILARRPCRESWTQNFERARPESMPPGARCNA
jgi:hypothetical protein